MFAIPSQRVFIWGCGGLMLAASRLTACPVPVFRYALEFGASWPYEVVVLHRGPLMPAERAVVLMLERAALDKTRSANLSVRTIDLATEPDESVADVGLSQPEQRLPWMAVRYPGGSQHRGIVWSGPSSMAAAKDLMDSPLRREIARSILKGEAVVWILLESGNRDKDDAAESLLRATHKKVQEAPRLPQLPDDVGVEFGWETDPEPEATFSLVRLSRSDPGEQMLITMLLHFAALPADSAAPVLCPVFARGRVLCTLTGAELNEENVARVYEFLTGPCSCLAGGLHTGAELLMAVNWDNLLADDAPIDKVLPSLTGGSRLVSLAAASEPETSIEPPTATGEPAGQGQLAAGFADELVKMLIRRAVIVLVVGVVGVAVVAVLLRLKSV